MVQQPPSRSGRWPAAIISATASRIAPTVAPTLGQPTMPLRGSRSGPTMRTARSPRRPLPAGVRGRGRASPAAPARCRTGDRPRVPRRCRRARRGPSRDGCSPRRAPSRSFRWSDGVCIRGLRRTRLARVSAAPSVPRVASCAGTSHRLACGTHHSATSRPVVVALAGSRSFRSQRVGTGCRADERQGKGGADQHRRDCRGCHQ